MKRIFSFLLLIICFSAHAQNVEKITYYYQGRKISFPVNYERLIIQSSSEAMPQGRRLQMSSILGLPDTALKQMADKRLVSAKLPKGANADFVKEKIASLRKQGFSGFVHPVFKSPSGKDVGYGDELVVKLKAATSLTTFDNYVKKNSCSIVKKYAFADKIYVLSAGPANNSDAMETANRFYESGLFEYAEPDFTLFDGLMTAPNDPLYSYQWAHENTGSAIQGNGTPGVDMKVQQAWAVTKGAGIKVAVIDVGIEIAHPDLQANMLQGYDCNSGTSNPGDGNIRSTRNAHGTPCAGIIAAVANNGIGVAGIAPESKIIPVNFADADGNWASYVNIAAGFDYAWQHGADVITNSWGGGGFGSVLDDAISRAVTLGRGGKGTVVLFSAGNYDGSGVLYPSSNPNVISVGGANMCGQRKSRASEVCDGEIWGSNYGYGLSVVAPCVRVATTDVTGDGGYVNTTVSDGNYSKGFNGTSAAAPNAAAVVALILAVNSNLTGQQARDILESSCKKLPGYSYEATSGQRNGAWNTETGYGFVDAYHAVQMAGSATSCRVQITGPSRFCPGSNALLNVLNPTAGTVYQWRINGSNLSTGTTLNATRSGNYDVIATGASGCIAVSAPLVVTELINSPVLTANAGVDTFITPGQLFKLGGDVVASNGAPWLPEKRVYGMDRRNNSFVKFNVKFPESIETISTHAVSDADFASGAFFTGGDFTPYGYYAVSKQTNKLVKVDTATGAQQLIGIAQSPNQYEWTDIAWDQSTKTLYALAAGQGGHYLCTIDPFTAAVSMVAPVNLTYTSWLAVSRNGTLFAFSRESYFVCTLDKKTGAVTYLPSYNSIVFTEQNGVVLRNDAAIDPLTDNIYFTSLEALLTPTSTFRNVDKISGAANIVGVLGSSVEVDAIGIAGPAYQYNWSPAAGLSSTTVSVPVASPLATTTYTLKVTDMCGNTASSQVTLSVCTRPPVTIKAASDSMCNENTIRLSATSNNSYAYQWFKDDVAIAGATDSIYLANNGGVYTVRAKRDGCDSLSRPVTLKQCQVLMNGNEPVSLCKVLFFDSGGPIGNYGDNEYFTKTFTSSIPGRAPQVSIDSFFLFGNDYLAIYNGPSTSSGQFTSLTGVSTTPQTFIATGNAITVEFRSDASVNRAGWYGSVNCFEPSVYRSRTSGRWLDVSTWEVKTGNGFISAASLPVQSADSIIIQSGHTVVLDGNSNYIDQIWVQAGGLLRITGDGYLSLQDGPGTDLVVDGTLDMIDNAYIIGFGTIKINGALNNKVSSPSIHLYAKTEIAGQDSQVINLSNGIWVLTVTNPMATINLSNTLSIDTLKINSGNDGVLQINGPYQINIFHRMDLQSGRVKVGDNSILNLNATCSVTGGGVSSFIEGALRRNTNTAGVTSLFFPVGKGVYRPVTLATTAPSATLASYQVQAMNTAPPARILPASINAVSAVRYFKILKIDAVSPTTATVTLSYGTDDVVPDAPLLRIVKDDGAGNWINLGGTGTANGTGTIASTVNFTSFGDFVLASTTAAALPLCVTNTSPANGSALPSQTSARLVWPASTAAASYDVYLATGNATPTLLATNTTALTYYATGLTAGTLYSWYIAPKNANGTNTACGATNKTTFTTAAATGGANIAPVANAGSSISITLPVSSVTLDGSASYDPDGRIAEFYWYVVQAPVTTSISSAFSMTPTITGLTTAGNYIYGLQVKDNNGVTAYAQVTVTVNPAGAGTVPACVTNTSPAVGATLTTQNTATLIWPSSATATSYDVYLAAGTGTPATLVANTTALTYGATGLTAGATYTWYIAPKNASGANTACGTSNATSFTTAAGSTLPACVINTSPANGSALPSQTSARLVWPASTAATSYDVYLATGNAVPTLLATNTTALTYYATGLTAGTLYSWYIAPKNANGTNTACGATNKTTFTTAAATGGANIAPVANAGSSISITLPVSSVTLDGSASYDPDGRIAEFYWYVVQAPVTTSISSAFSMTPTITGLTTAGNYTYGLQVKDNNGVTAYSQVTVTVNPAGAGTVPACVTNTSPAAGATLTTQNTATLIWPSSATATSYDVYLAAGTGTPATLVTNTTALTYGATGLTAGATYTWYIAPKNASGANTACATSNTSSFTTAAAATLPACVTNTSPAAGAILPSQTSARLVWPTSAGATSYDVYLATGNAVPTLLATNTTALTYYATGLTAGTLYSWSIAPRNANGANTACGATNRTTFTTATATGGANIAPLANAGSNVSITLPVSSVTLDASASYDPDGRIAEFYWYVVQAPVTTSISSAFSMTPTITGLTTAGNYIYGLQVKDNNGVTAYAQITVTVNPAGAGTVPACVTNTSPAAGATLTTQNTATLTWPSSATATSYDLYLAAGTGTPATLVANTTALTYGATGLTAGTTYSWYIAPRNASGANTACATSNTSSFTTAAASTLPACVTNTSPAAGSILPSQTSARLVWPTSAGATSYDVYLATGNAIPTLLATNTTALTYYATGLTAGTLYSWYVAPGNANGANTACGSANRTTFTTAAATGGANIAPVANAGSNVLITLPVSSVTLDASASYDPDGRIAEFYWYVVQAPVTTSISSAFSMTPTITGLTTAGNYIYGLQVKDNNGVTAYSQVTVTVKAAGTAIANTIALQTANAAAEQNSTAAPLIAITVNPNPVARGSFARLQITSNKIGSAEINIVNSSGSVTSTKKVNLVRGINTTSIATSSLAQGLYIISINGIDKPANLKLLVIH